MGWRFGNGSEKRARRQRLQPLIVLGYNDRTTVFFRNTFVLGAAMAIFGYTSAYRIGTTVTYRYGGKVYSGTVEGVGHDCLFVQVRSKYYRVDVEQVITPPDTATGRQSKPSDIALCSGPGQSATGRPWGL